MEFADYLPIALMSILGIGFAGVSIFLSKKLAPHNPTPEKLAPYECGIVPLQDPVIRFPVKFYLVAMLFVIFDVEIVFLFLWAVRMDQFGWVGIGAVVLFMLMLIETLGYVWKRGALDWNVARRARNRRVVAPVATLDEAA
ncbi:MAG: NADH-quinone oxidoreductase subunit A [Acidimicrobiia bacterium]|nr:NADH-quinone oxidoreductase subunit A [Acidimicrobiia bacterium]